MTAKFSNFTNFGLPIDWALLLGRLLVVVQLLPNGWRKIASFDMTAAMMGGAPPVMLDGRLFPAQEPLFYFPLPALFLSASIAFDLLGSLLLIAGAKARPVAAFLTGYVLFAMTIYHSDIHGPQEVIAVIRNLPFVGGLLLLAGTGAGRWSVDGWRLQTPRR